MLVSFASYFSSEFWINDKLDLLKSNATALAAYAKEKVESPNYNLEVGRTGDAVSEASDITVFFVDVNRNTFTCSEIKQKLDCVHIGSTVNKDIMDRVYIDGIYTDTTTLGGMYKTDHYTVGAPITGYYECYGAVFVSYDASNHEAFIKQIIWGLIYAGIFCLILGFVLIYIITNKLVKPIVDVSNAANAMIEGDYSHRIEVKRTDEIGTLVTSFNNMVEAQKSLETMRSSFIANVSHELKTPMTTIGGFIDGILDGTIPVEKHEHYLGIVSDEVKRLSVMVNAMLSLSKLESGQTELKNIAVDVTEIICRVIISFSLKLESKNIEIQGMDDASQFIVDGDYDLLYQSIYNLFDNAIKFTPENGVIELNIDSLNRTISITNSGKGIKDEDIEFIFDRFYKADKSRSKDKSGFGLGLFIVKSIINIHNGNISVESEYGKSTTFTVTLPK
ncbi:MAG: HAMP domain-containing histidine kinase [Clostridia bacterium]|nr:HAMP domain-containing histidine kinase [Clostridia bacterium]